MVPIFFDHTMNTEVYLTIFNAFLKQWSDEQNVTAG
jgi:hypothetical protein